MRGVTSPGGTLHAHVMISSPGCRGSLGPPPGARSAPRGGGSSHHRADGRMRDVTPRCPDGRVACGVSRCSSQPASRKECEHARSVDAICMWPASPIHLHQSPGLLPKSWQTCCLNWPEAPRQRACKPIGTLPSEATSTPFLSFLSRRLRTLSSRRVRCQQDRLLNVKL